MSKTIKKRELISREEWILKLMQGMIGDYGNGKWDAKCYYDNGAFWAKEEGEKVRVIRFECMRTDNFWITDRRGL